MLIKKGDVIFYNSTLVDQHRLIITRVTDNRAIVGNLRFRRLIGDNGFVMPVGKESRVIRSAYIWSQEREDAYQRKLLIKKARSVSFEKMTDKELKIVIEMGEPYRNDNDAIIKERQNNE